MSEEIITEDLCRVIDVISVLLLLYVTVKLQSFLLKIVDKNILVNLSSLVTPIIRVFNLFMLH